MKTKATQEVINEMILNYLDNPKWECSDYYMNYNFTDDQIKELGNAYNFRVHIMCCDTPPDIKHLDECLEKTSKLCVFEMTRIIEKYKLYTVDLMNKYKNKIDVYNMIYHANKKLTNDEILQVIDVPEVGFKFNYNTKKYIVINVSKNKRTLICKNVNYENDLMTLTLRINGRYVKKGINKNHYVF